MSIGFAVNGMVSCGFHAGGYTSMFIIAATVAMILLLLLVVKCITADDCKSSKKETIQTPVQKKDGPERKNETLFCPMCGWQHPKEQKVCRNPNCQVRF